MEMRIDKRALIERALGELKHAYAPYSGFRVAAALLCEDGTVYTGVKDVYKRQTSPWAGCRILPILNMPGSRPGSI